MGKNGTRLVRVRCLRFDIEGVMRRRHKNGIDSKVTAIDSSAVPNGSCQVHGASIRSHGRPSESILNSQTKLVEIRVRSGFAYFYTCSTNGRVYQSRGRYKKMLYLKVHDVQ